MSEVEVAVENNKPVHISTALDVTIETFVSSSIFTYLLPSRYGVSIENNKPVHISTALDVTQKLCQFE